MERVRDTLLALDGVFSMPENTMTNIWDCPLCGALVDTSDGKLPRLPASCRLKRHSIGPECIARRDVQQARRILLEERE